MMPSRLVITVLVLSLSFMDIYAAENIQKINVTVGENVLLPCPCPKNTDQVVWQIDDDIVNMYSEKNNSEKVHEFYINRTQLFTKSEKENCSLLLLNASSLDMKNFTCNLFSPFLSTSTVELNVVSHEKPDSGSFIAPSPTPEVPKPSQRSVAVGASLLLVLGIVIGVTIALFRKHCCPPQRVVRQEAQKQPMIPV